jgi:hypothetical protein
MFEKMGVLVGVGNKLAYTNKATGEVISEFRKNWTEEKLMSVMMDWDVEVASAMSTGDTIDESVEDVEEA